MRQTETTSPPYVSFMSRTPKTKRVLSKKGKKRKAHREAAHQIEKGI